MAVNVLSSHYPRDSILKVVLAVQKVLSSTNNTHPWKATMVNTLLKGDELILVCIKVDYAVVAYF